MKHVIWKKSNFADELSEFERIVKSYSYENGRSAVTPTDRKQYAENLKTLKTSYASSSISSLSDVDWKKMVNTDSWSTDTVKKMENAINRNGEPRDVARIFYQYAALSVYAPIAIRREDGILELIAGNTRLMGAKVLGITPKIVIIKTDW